MSNPKTAAGVITHVLRELGLTQGVDFRAHGYVGRCDGVRQRLATRVDVAGTAANQKIAESAQRVETATAELGQPFRVRVDVTRSGTSIVYVHGPA